MASRARNCCVMRSASSSASDFMGSCVLSRPHASLGWRVGNEPFLAAARSGKGATEHLTAASSQPHVEDSNESRQARETDECIRCSACCPAEQGRALVPGLFLALETPGGARAIGQHGHASIEKLRIIPA